MKINPSGGKKKKKKKNWILLQEKTAYSVRTTINWPWTLYLIDHQACVLFILLYSSRFWTTRGTTLKTLTFTATTDSQYCMVRQSSTLLYWSKLVPWICITPCQCWHWQCMCMLGHVHCMKDGFVLNFLLMAQSSTVNEWK